MAAGDVAWDGTTTSIIPYRLYNTPHGIAYSKGSTLAIASSTDSFAGLWCKGGVANPLFVQSSGDVLTRIPFVSNHDLLVNIVYATPTSNGMYPGIILQRPPRSKNVNFGYSTVGNAGSTIGLKTPSSTNDNGYVMFVSTAGQGANSSDFFQWQCRVNTGRFGFNDMGSTGAGTSAYDNYIVMAPALSTVGGAAGTLKSTGKVSLACSSWNYVVANIFAYDVE